MAAYLDDGTDLPEEPTGRLRYKSWGLRGIWTDPRNAQFFPAGFPLAPDVIGGSYSRAGTLKGLEVPVRRVETVTPYVLGSSSRDFQKSSSFNSTGDWGVDAKYGVTPSLTLDATVNTGTIVGQRYNAQASAEVDTEVF